MVSQMVKTIPTTPYLDQKPGTSGLRKKVSVFSQPHYVANFAQSVFNSIPESEFVGQTLLVSGDGRYYSVEAIAEICAVAAANGVKRVLVGANGWMSTPAASCVIRKPENDCAGGFILTASHNPGGPTGDFGIKYNRRDGEPAPESVTDKVFAESKSLKELKYSTLVSEYISANTDMISKTGDYTISYEDDRTFTVSVIDPVADWVALMKTIFDFELLKQLVSNPEFGMMYDGMNGIGGPYAKALFAELGLKEDNLVCCEPLVDFGGIHPDPNLTYAKSLVDLMHVADGMAPGADRDAADNYVPVFAAATDADCDRNMILGRGWFVTPSDSVAIIAHYAQKCIPFFAKSFPGVARSMPTSLALNNVAKKLGIPCYEVPTGWKFFGNLMDAGKIVLCGEESYGTGSSHIREKDGLWAVLCWMSILAYKLSTEGRMVQVKEIHEDFWKQYGRNYYVRYDYENYPTEPAQAILAGVLAMTTDEANKMCETYTSTNPVTEISEFTYTDPVDQSVSANQGVRVYFKDGSRFVLRLSGTGSTGATIRLYLEKYETDETKLFGKTEEVMEEFINVALDLCKFQELIGTREPTVRT